MAIHTNNRAHLIAGIVAIFFLGLTTPSAINNFKEGKKVRQEFQERLTLVDRCNQIAAGEDGVLDIVESYDLAKAVGYEGVLRKGQRIKLIAPEKKRKLARLSVFYDEHNNNPLAYTMFISDDAMRDYLNSRLSP